MRIFDILSVCWSNLTRRKLRTVLTALGVVIGVCAILVMISLGIGLSKSFDEQLSQWGDLTVIEVYGGAGTKETTLNDAAVATFQGIEGVDIATAFYRAEFPLNIRTKNGRYETQWLSFYGIAPEALEKFGYEIGSGTSLVEGDKEYSIVVGEQFAYGFRDTKRKRGRGDTVSPWPDENTGIIKKPFVDVEKDKLFLYSKPDKEGAKPLEVKLHVAGVMKKSDARYESYDSVFMDIAELKLLHAKYNKLAGLPKPKDIVYDQIKVKCKTMDEVAAVQKQIEDMGFGCWSMESNRESMQQQAQMIQMVLGGLAAISLFVAAIGIANTMFMSIIERTREIGIMKVIGAEVGNIRTMFLIEAGMIGFLGGLMGVGLSYLLSYAINSVVKQGLYGMPVSGSGISIIPPYLVLFALGFSILIGVIFGFLPANRAVKISALEAIKHD